MRNLKINSVSNPISHDVNSWSQTIYMPNEVLNDADE